MTGIKKKSALLILVSSMKDGKLDPGSSSIPIISKFGEENLVLCRLINGEKSLNLTFLLFDGNLP
jgi:hypothetical protein